jgi:hypothetical protein
MPAAIHSRTPAQPMSGAGSVHVDVPPLGLERPAPRLVLDQEPLETIHYATSRGTGHVRGSSGRDSSPRNRRSLLKSGGFDSTASAPSRNASASRSGSM